MPLRLRGATRGRAARPPPWLWRSRGDLLQLDELEPEVAEPVQEAIELCLVLQGADEDGSATARFDTHALERRGEAVADRSTNRDPIATRLLHLSARMSPRRVICLHPVRRFTPGESGLAGRERLATSRAYVETDGVDADHGVAARSVSCD